MAKSTITSDNTTPTEDSDFKAIVEGHPESILVLDDKGRPLYANATASGLLSRLAGAGDRLPDAITMLAENADRLTLSDLTGNEVVLAIRARSIRWHGTRARLLYITDETYQTRRHESLARLAYTDHLTGLYNRRGLELVADHHCLVAARAGEHVVAFFIDLDGLKQINDNFGHSTGDEALVELADVVATVFRDSDIKARVGGDEFVVLINEDAPGRVDHLLARISTEVERRNAVPGRHHTLSVSIGMARHEPNARLDIEKLLAEADKSMYDAKRHTEPGMVRDGDRASSTCPSVTETPDLSLMFLAL